MSPVIHIHASVHTRLIEHARLTPLLECCGLLAGRDAVITTVLPATNALASATAFDIAPRELFALFREMRRAGLDHLGIYHSHPSGDNSPSARDIERAYYPDAAYFIVSPREDAPRPVRAFSIQEGRIAEIGLEVVAE
jgi:proteasome lid subunit RPN8/RPN11